MSDDGFRPVSLAIVGCGQITDYSHLPAALQSPLVDVVALVDADADRARTLATKYGCAPAIASDLGAVVDRVEAVVVATPNHTHSTVSRCALAKGRPVLVEKPLTTTAADAEDLCRLAHQTSTFISVGFVTRHQPVVGLMKRLLDDAYFGSLNSFTFQSGSVGGWAPVSGYNLDVAKAGGGVLVVTGTHFLDRMLYWFGEPTSFDFYDDSHGGVESTCRAVLRFPGGLSGTLLLSKTVQLKTIFKLHTERYVVDHAWSDGHSLELRPHGPPRVNLRAVAESREPDDLFLAQIEHFARCVRGQALPLVDGEAGARSVRLCESLYAARQPLDEPWAWYTRPEART